MEHTRLAIPLSRLREPVRIPPFHAVPSRARADGWTPPKQAEFIGQLAETRCVAEAARRVGMRRETAYRLRRRRWSASFVAAWDAALGRREPVAAESHTPESHAPESHTAPSRKVTHAELEWRVESGLWQVILRGGRYRGVRRTADNGALLALLGRSGPGFRRTPSRAAASASSDFPKTPNAVQPPAASRTASGAVRPAGRSRIPRA